MNTIHCLLGIIGGASFGYAMCSLIPVFGLNVKDFGVAAAICAGCVLGICLVKAIQEDRQHRRARMNAYRDAVWQRRLRESRQRTTHVRRAS
jgi:ABC-type Fe3+-siderophore transport system permease subunit